MPDHEYGTHDSAILLRDPASLERSIEVAHERRDNLGDERLKVQSRPFPARTNRRGDARSGSCRPPADREGDTPVTPPRAGTGFPASHQQPPPGRRTYLRPPRELVQNAGFGEENSLCSGCALKRFASGAAGADSDRAAPGRIRKASQVALACVLRRYADHWRVCGRQTVREVDIFPGATELLSRNWPESRRRTASRLV
jgi:hypothetical protein